jgi:GT2 family glycosyltransferase
VLVARREEFRSVGGFDPRYFLYVEDVDLSRRYQGRRLPLRLTDGLIAEHAGAASSASDDDTKPIPHAWSILGTLEYISIWEGEEAAARAARIALRSLRLQQTLLRLLPGRRFARKRGQVEAIEAFLVAHARAEPADGSYCPGAQVPLRSLV